MMIEDVVSIMKDELVNVMELLNQHLNDVMMEMIDRVNALTNGILDQMMMKEKIDDSKQSIYIYIYMLWPILEFSPILILTSRNWNCNFD
jgi:hypothetical protein